MKAAFAACCALAALPSFAFADEPYLPVEPRVMHEPGEVVDVADAFDRGVPFQVHIALAFMETVRWAAIDHHDTTGKVLDTLLYRGTASSLVPRIDVGLYHDLAFYISMPITLSATYTISTTKNATSVSGPDGENLFTLPFHSPDRSGPEWLAAGFDTDIFNQMRKASFPTWLLGAEVRIPVGVSLHACNVSSPMGEVACAAPGDINRNGKTDPGEPKGITQESAGNSRGTVGLELHSFISRRIHFFEPYAGVEGVVEVPLGNSDFSLVKQAGGGIPPVILEGSIGTLLIPWEDREHFSRVTLDMRVSASAHTSGPEATELYDALGSSSATSIRAPIAGAIPFSGVTRVAAFPAGRIATEATWQSSKYIKLSVNIRGGYEGNHSLTVPDSTNAAYRSAIAGFDSRSRFTLDVGAKAVVMF